MSELRLKVAKCYATKSEEAKYSHILHLALPTKVPVKDAAGNVLYYDERVVYLRKGAQAEIPKDTELVFEQEKYQVTSHESTWVDEDSGEERTATEHWLSLKPGF